MAKFNDAFWTWFGDSKVVDENGDPLVVYHGTNEDFNEFKDVGKKNSRLIGNGFYFTSDKKQAASYGKRLIAVYLKIERPRHNLDTGLLPPDSPSFDGVIAKDSPGTKTGELVFVARKPSQIKSIGNDGTWDADDPDIRSNPDDLKLENYLHFDSKGMLLSKCGGFKFVAWHSPRGTPHHEEVQALYFPDWTIESKLSYHRTGLAVTAELAKSRDEALRTLKRAVAYIMWEDVYDDTDFIFDWGYIPKKVLYTESEVVPVSQIGKRLGVARDLAENPSLELEAERILRGAR